jgi:hypothetical protein
MRERVGEIERNNSIQVFGNVDVDVEDDWMFVSPVGYIDLPYPYLLNIEAHRRGNRES